MIDNNDRNDSFSRRFITKNGKRIQGFTDEEIDVMRKARRLGLIEDGWFNEDGSFRAGAVQQRVREEEELRDRKKQMHTAGWLSMVQNQTTVFASIIGFLGLVVSVLVVFNNNLLDSSAVTKFVYVVLVFLDYIFIAGAAVLLYQIAKLERKIAWDGENAPDSKKNLVNAKHYKFENLFYGVLVMTGVLIGVIVLLNLGLIN